MPKVNSNNGKKKTNAALTGKKVKEEAISLSTEVIERGDTDFSQKQEQHNLFLTPKIVQIKEEPKKEPNEIPYAYGDDKIVLLVRDPHWIFAYWELTENKYNEARSILGNDFARSREIVRVYDSTKEPWSSFDISVFGAARNWYINVPGADRSYFVEIGHLAPDGRFIVMARSNVIRTPRDSASDVIDEEWLTIDFDKMFALSGGFGFNRNIGSANIKELIEKNLISQQSSGWVTSMSSPYGGGPAAKRPFFLVANTELIVYGATEPTAQLFVQGKKINLRSDGTFTLRFALPDGRQVIPIEAIRDDGAEKRSITPIVERRTE